MSDTPENPENEDGNPPGRPPYDGPSVSILDEMKTSYLDYAMSVIVSRAIPDLRDGLKPVHRRILYAMHETGNTHDKAYRKSARPVGDVMGKYHPHGDTAAYDAMVRLAQPFAMRYPLVEGQGNFGNIDGDNAAAYRYTEARLTKTAMQLMEGLDEGTVDFVPTYNNETTEPVLMPGLFPNLLANGASGIAVGMATNIPSHNAAEVIDATLELIDNPHVEHSRLMELMKGPDFATGGQIIDSAEVISQAYETGRGSFRLRGVFEAPEAKSEEDKAAGIERLGGGQWQLVITEIPYQVQKGKLIEQIAQAISDGEKCTGSDLDTRYSRIVSVINPTDMPQTLPLLVDDSFALHPVQAASSDAIVRTAAHSASGFFVPARTTAVFVEDEPQVDCGNLGVDVYLRGSFNDFAATENVRFDLRGNDTADLTVPLTSELFFFKVADDTFDVANCGLETRSELTIADVFILFNRGTNRGPLLLGLDKPP